MTLYLFKRGKYRFCVYASSVTEAMSVAVCLYDMPPSELSYICTITHSVAYEDHIDIL